MNTPTFERYAQEKLDQLLNMPGIVKVVSGAEIDIVVLEKKDGRIEPEIEALRSELEARWFKVEELGFMYEDSKSILNPKTTSLGGAGTFLSFEQVGLDALEQLRILEVNKLGGVIPPTMLKSQTYNASDLIALIGHLRHFGVDPADVVVGAKFNIVTESESSRSEYVITVNDEGKFEIMNDEINRKKPGMIGAKFTEFSDTRRLIGSGSNTSPIVSMVKIEPSI